MNTIKGIAFVAILLLMLCATYSSVNDGDICNTIFGCFLMWFMIKINE